MTELATPEALQERLQALPARPGVYLFKDSYGRVIYVGKAMSLRSRVRSYFQESVFDPKTRRLRRRIADLEFIITETELQALALELNLIKRHRPRFNIRLKDDKRHPYIKINWQDDFPRVLFTRQMRNDGARYFGPYAAAGSVRETLDALRKVFPFLTCKRKITGQDPSPCLYYHIRRCAGPCIGAINREDYRAMLDQMCRFLQGRGEEVLQKLEREMAGASEGLQFERAAVLRDRLRAVERIVREQKLVSPSLGDLDVVGLARQEGLAVCQVFRIRGGKIIGRENLLLEGTEGEAEAAVLASFLEQFYARAAYVPPEVVVPTEPADAELFTAWLRERRGARAQVKVPRWGIRRELLDLALENARDSLKASEVRVTAAERRRSAGLVELQVQLGLEEPPRRVECYDISHTGGGQTVASMVVFLDGLPAGDHYRRFEIRAVDGVDDYAAMAEVLRRRFRHAGTQDSDPSFSSMPDLIVLDGGRGQLGAGLGVLDEYGFSATELPVVALAKRKEEIFRPGLSEPLVLQPGSPALLLVQHLRNEAHRFALTYHRRKRGEAALESILDDIAGIGPSRKRNLLLHFGSVQKIREASAEELAAVRGMSRPAAQKVKEYLSGP